MSNQITNQFRLGVVGNPIEHSISPQIHSQFACQFGHQADYHKYLVEPTALVEFVTEFFTRGGQGLNVTLPFKRTVVAATSQLTERARLSGSVNTLSLNQDGLVVGDTTDGEGLCLDLNARKLPYQGRHLLLIGAGGACHSVIVALLSAGCQISIYNRSQDKAAAICEKYQALGSIRLWQPTLGQKVDGVISSVSQFNAEFLAPLKPVLASAEFAYDLNYAERAAGFLRLAKAAGCQRCVDGLGMLLGQAALSYEIWTGQLPDISQVSL